MLLNTILTKIDNYTTKHPWKNGSKQILQNAMSDNKSVMDYLESIVPTPASIDQLRSLVPDAFPRELQKCVDIIVKKNIHGQWRVDPPEVVTVSKKKQRNEHLNSLMDQM
jgi:hypothetical protein